MSEALKKMFFGKNTIQGAVALIVIVSVMAYAFATTFIPVPDTDGNQGSNKVLTSDASGNATWGNISLQGYTVATLPAGTVGDIAYVTDATTPTYLGTLTGGGAVVTPVFYNGSAWVSH